MLNKLINWRPFQVFGLVVMLLLIADQSYAYAGEQHSMLYFIGCLLLEMCAVRHPAGHIMAVGFFDWSIPERHPVLSSIVQWGSFVVGAAAWWKFRR